MKIKCMGKEEPPCNRCRGIGESCTFLMKANTKPSEAERVRQLEVQLSEVQASLANINAARTLDHKPTLTSSQGNTGQPSWHNPVQKGLSHHADITPLDYGRSDGNDTASEGDDSEEDPLRDGATSAPLRDTVNAVASSHRNMSHQIETQRKRPIDHLTPSDAQSKKRSRNDDSEMTYSRIVSRVLPFDRGVYSHVHVDPISCGLITEDDAERLYDLFFSQCHIYMPLFDQRRDTLEQLRVRSAFCLSAILMVAKIAEDPGGVISDMQLRLRNHAEGIAKDTMFTDIAGLDVVQGLILLASWGSLGWRTGNHALSIAYDMGLQDCMPYLALTRMGEGKSDEELVRDQAWIEGARVWLVLYKMKVEMAINNGSPVQFDDGNTMTGVRAFLNHPLSTELDGRLVAACELLDARLLLHNTGKTQADPMDGAIEPVVRLVNHRVEAWQVFWNDFYDRQAVQNHAIKAIMTIQVDFTLLHVNARMLHGLKTVRDVTKLSDDRLLCLHRALAASRHLVQDTVRSARVDLRFDVAIAYAARCYLRLSSLLPHSNDLRQVGRDVEDLAGVMASYPGLQVSEHLRSAVDKAREARLLPPSSKLNSPTSRHPTLPGGAEDFGLFAELNAGNPGPPQSDDPAFGADFQWNQGWDFSLADQLFSTVTEPHSESAGHGLAFWDRASAL